MWERRLIMAYQRERSWFVTADYIRKNSICGLTVEEINKLTDEEILKVVADKWMDKYLGGACAITYCVSAKGMEHLHAVLENENAISFSSVKKFLGKKANIEATKGSKEQALNYINKVGEYAESGEIIKCKLIIGEIQGKRMKPKSDKSKLQAAVDEMLEDGLTPDDVIGCDAYLLKNKETLWEMYSKELKEQYREDGYTIKERKVYLDIGATGSGKSQQIRDLIKKGKTVCKVTDYTRDPFGGYRAQEYLFLEEYRGTVDQQKTVDWPLLLNLMDLDIIDMPARYYNRPGLYKEIHIVTPLSLEKLLDNLLGAKAIRSQHDKAEQFISRLTAINYFFALDEDGNVLDNPREYRKTGKKMTYDIGSLRPDQYDDFDDLLELANEASFIAKWENSKKS